MKKTVETFSPLVDELSPEEISRLHLIMVNAYAGTEEEIWGANYVRMSEDVFKSFIDKNELVVARLDGKLVGSVRIYEESPKIFNLSVFSVDQELRGNGAGSKLVYAGEEHARRKGGTKLTLEILRPQNFELKVKTRLTNWYKRLGYNFISSMLFEDRKPDNIEKLKLLKVPVIFDCYEKEL